MGDFMLVLATVLLIVLAISWSLRIQRQIRRMIEVQREHPELDSYDETIAGMRSKLYAEIFLAFLMVGALGYYVLPRAFAALTSVHGPDYQLTGQDFGGAVSLAERVLIVLGGTLILFGLFIAFVPKLFPLDEQSRTSRMLSLSVAICLSLAFALWFGTSDTAYQVLRQQLDAGFLRILVAFISVLFGMIGAYLSWKRFRSS